MLCQIANQTHSAIVNYTNRNAAADDKGNNHEIKGAFFCAIVSSSLVAIGCRNAFLPLCAVTVGHILNLPIVRYKEVANGIPVYVGDTEEPLMRSRVAAVKGISECLVSRIVMSTPCLFFIPAISQNIKVYCFYQRRPWIKFPIQALLCSLGCFIIIPVALAIFPQCTSMDPELMKLYPSEYEEFQNKVKEHVDKVYYNKGL
ncbi:sideroflexin-2-like [Calliopsis andreniformis]|uniref:sideroflexin-2-like n=1 Tax=Calliopsis andreniformis TaxID=337506 RepID=UPI003FCEA7FF